jgi:hypothetical protein
LNVNKTKIDDEGIVAIVTSPSMKNLVKLFMKGLDGISNQSFKAVVQSKTLPPIFNIE